MTRLHRILRFFPWFLMLAAATLHAQIVGGAITGVVQDSTGAALPGATVTVRNAETGSTRTLTSGADGRFSAPSVPVGEYSISVARDGFAAQQRTGVSLVVGQSLDLTFRLNVGSVAQEIVVNSQPPSVNTTTQSTSGLIDERQVKELPLNGRSYDSLVQLNPSTVNYTAELSSTV